MKDVLEDISLPDRRLTDSVKWRCTENELPMWVADMDFPVAAPIAEALKAKAAEGIYGYTERPSAWEKAYIDYYHDVHGLDFEPRNLFFSQGVVPSVSCAVRAFSRPGDAVMVFTPNYHVFYHSVTNNGRRLIGLPLKEDGKRYAIDFEALEKTFQDERPAILIMSNPHNPSGLIFEAEELSRIADLAAIYGVFVISDEIHGEIVEPGSSYVPYFSASSKARENSLTCLSPTKAWNIAGLQTSAVLIYDEKVSKRMGEALNADELGEGNFFSYAASISAYQKGRAWLKALNAKIRDNRSLVRDFLGKEIPEISLFEGRATYLLWLDARPLLRYGDDFPAFLRSETGLWLSDGASFFPEGEKPVNGFLRMNVATSTERLLDGLNRLKEGAHLFKNRP